MRCFWLALALLFLLVTTTTPAQVGANLAAWWPVLVTVYKGTTVLAVVGGIALLFGMGIVAIAKRVFGRHSPNETRG